MKSSSERGLFSSSGEDITWWKDTRATTTTTFPGHLMFDQICNDWCHIWQMLLLLLLLLRQRLWPDLNPIASVLTNDDDDNSVASHCGCHQRHHHQRMQMKLTLAQNSEKTWGTDGEIYKLVTSYFLGSTEVAFPHPWFKTQCSQNNCFEFLSVALWWTKCRPPDQIKPPFLGWLKRKGCYSFSFQRDSYKRED